MRHLPALALATVAILALTGCEERLNMRELPDRGGHAYRTGGAERPLAAGAMLPYEGEQVYTVLKGENLRTVSKKFGVTEAWIIRRNRLDNHVLSAGQALIVPKPK